MTRQELTFEEPWTYDGLDLLLVGFIDDDGIHFEQICITGKGGEYHDWIDNVQTFVVDKARDYIDELLSHSAV